MIYQNLKELSENTLSLKDIVCFKIDGKTLRKKVSNSSSDCLYFLSGAELTESEKFNTDVYHLFEIMSFMQIINEESFLEKFNSKLSNDAKILMCKTLKELTIVVKELFKICENYERKNN